MDRFRATRGVNWEFLSQLNPAINPSSYVIIVEILYDNYKMIDNR